MEELVNMIVIRVTMTDNPGFLAVGGTIKNSRFWQDVCDETGDPEAQRKFEEGYKKIADRYKMDEMLTEMAILCGKICFGGGRPDRIINMSGMDDLRQALKDKEKEKE